MELVKEFMYSVVLLRMVSIVIINIVPSGTYRKLIRTFLNLILIRLVIWFFTGIIYAI